MNNQELLHDPNLAASVAADAGNGVLAARRQYVDVPAGEVFEQAGPGLLLEYVRILRRRRGTLLLIVFLGLLASVLLTLPQTPIYQARASLEIQNLNENFLNMGNVSPTSNDNGSAPTDYDLQTQLQILRSDSVLEGVIAKLRLDRTMAAEQNSGRIAAWRQALGLPASESRLTQDAILNATRKNLTARITPNSRLVEILYDSPDPQLAANFVNALATEFIRQNLDARRKVTQQTGDWLRQQMEDVRIKLEKSEDDLQSYAQVSGLLFASEKDNVAEDKLRELQEELSKAQADRVAAQSKYELASTASPDSLPEVLDDLTLKEYQVKLTDLRRQLADLSSSLTPSHPSVKKVQAQVATLQTARDTERSNVVQRIRGDFDAAQRREKLLAADYAAQSRLMTDQAAKVAHYNILKREVDTNTQLYDSMLHSVQEASMTSALRASNIRIVDAAHPPARPYKPSLPVNSALGILAGAFLGVAFVVTQERADHCIRAPGEAALYLDVPELGAIPSTTARNRLYGYYGNGSGNGAAPKSGANGDSRLPVELVTSDHKPSALADAFRATLTSILYSGENGTRPRLIVVTSANPGEGKTTVASNLALALAEIGAPTLKQPVLLIDGDLRRPRLHEIFGVANTWGLADLLQGKTPPTGCEGAVFRTRFPNLFLLPSGSMVFNSAGLLHSPQALAHLRRMREEFHAVIIDSPPMLHMPDARVLGRFSDGVVLVLHSAQTMREEAAFATRRLTEDGTRVLGVILNRWDLRRASPYRHNHAYAYGDGYSYRTQ